MSKDAQSECLIEMDQGEQHLPEPKQMGIVNDVDTSFDFVRLHPDQLDDVHLGKDEELVFGLDQEAGDDGEGQGEHQGQPCPPAHLCVDFDRAAEMLDVCDHHVHADSSSAQVGDLIHR